jgi:hypothetical protein
LLQLPDYLQGTQQLLPRALSLLPTTPGVLIEEIWIRIKEALRLHINNSNYDSYVEDTHAIAFDRTSGTLTVQAPDYVVADHLNRYFTRSLRWAIADAKPSIPGVRIYAVHFVPAPHRAWEAAEHDHHAS